MSSSQRMRLPPMPSSKPPPLPEQILKIKREIKEEKKKHVENTLQNQSESKPLETSCSKSESSKSELLIDTKLAQKAKNVEGESSWNSIPHRPVKTSPKGKERSNSKRNSVQSLAKLSSHLYVAFTKSKIRSTRFTELAIKNLIRVNVSESVKSQYDKEDVRIMYIDIEDDDRKTLLRLTENIEDFEEKKEVSLVQSEEVNLAAFISMAFLIKKYSMSATEALEEIMSKWPELRIDFKYKQQLNEFELFLQRRSQKQNHLRRISNEFTKYWFQFALGIIIIFAIIRLLFVLNKQY